MFEQIGEKEVLVAKHNPNTNTSRKTNNESQMTSLCDSYKKRMIDYMQSIPHIPPTLFELRLKHNDIKNDVIKQFKKINNKNTTKQLVSKLDNQMEKLFVNLAKKNMKEYKTCQAGFIIGWKCNVNKLNYKVEGNDDRF
jgi:hypothetical protein